MHEKVTIREINSDIEFLQWDKYVQEHVKGTFFHLSGWKYVVEKTYGHKMMYLAAYEGETLIGILPLGHIKSRLFGNALISSPFCVYGGAIADDSAIVSKLELAAAEEARKQQVDFLELRNLEKTQEDWPVKELYVTFRKEMDSDPENNLKAIPRRQRRMVRQGIKANLISYIEDDVDSFFHIYSTSVRNHGTPVFPKSFFQNIKRTFNDKCEIRIVKKDNELVSAVMSFYFRDEVLPYYGGGLPVARKYSAFDFMYWDLMQTACQAGVRIFDYGRSKIGTGSYSFKKNWGFIPQPLPYQYCLINCKHVPEINPLNPKYQIFIKAWKTLPVPIANIIGPWLARNLG